MAKSKLILAKNEIFSLFSKSPGKIYSHTQLATILRENRTRWNLAAYTRFQDFTSFLTKQGNLHAHKFRSKTYGQEITRYSWGKPPILEIILSLKPRAYLSHATAAMLHGLIESNEKIIYLNAEQSAKQPNQEPLSQEGIKRAFSSKPRQSKLIYAYDGFSIVMVAGKNTKNMGVEKIETQESKSLQITNLERTLIDIVVRPIYAGGPHRLFEAYRAAKNDMSIDRLLILLKNLGYLYPYHQAIGFLMQRAGYSNNSYDKIRALGLNYDFYLANGIKDPEYSEEWRLFYPKNLH
ncbi:MAG: hypothetical protein WD005_04630 [Haliea sp.]